MRPLRLTLCTAPTPCPQPLPPAVLRRLGLSSFIPLSSWRTDTLVSPPLSPTFRFSEVGSVSWPIPATGAFSHLQTPLHVLGNSQPACQSHASWAVRPDTFLPLTSEFPGTQQALRRLISETSGHLSVQECGKFVEVLGFSCGTYFHKVCCGFCFFFCIYRSSSTYRGVPS